MEPAIYYAIATVLVIVGVVGTVLPVFVERAGGGVIVDVDDNSLIDLGSGIAVTSVGNAAPEVVRRVTEQVAAFTHTCFMVAPYEGYVEVCEQLADLTPGNHPKKSALFNSGAEAVETAIKAARRWGYSKKGIPADRAQIIVCTNNFHGRTTTIVGFSSDT